LFYRGEELLFKKGFFPDSPLHQFGTPFFWLYIFYNTIYLKTRPVLL